MAEQPITPLPVVAHGAAVPTAEPSNGDRQDRIRPIDVVFSQAFRSLNEGVLVVDRAGGLVSANPAACALLERTEAELRAPDWWESLDARNDAGMPLAGKFSFGTRAIASGHAMRELSVSVAKRDGTRTWLSVSYQPLISPGEVEVDGLVLSMRDITQQRKDQERLRADLQEARTLARIYEALATDRLMLYSQPILNLSTGECELEELLVRLIDHDGRVVGPCEFLPVAERHDAIVEIDCWVLRAAVALARDGRRLAINLSGRSAGDPRALDTLERSLRESQVDPSQLTIEITETAVAQDDGTVAQFAERLVDIGCGFALDDFGTGYGTLSYLKRLPVSFIKIDREFVADLLTSASSAKVITAIMAFAREFGLHTIAEGIENEATLEALRAMDVELGQGVHLAPPAPAVHL